MAATRGTRKSQLQYVPPAMPDRLELQHPRLVPRPPSGPGWIHEIKFDGYRLQLRIERGRVRIWTRNGHDWTDRFPELAEDAAELPDAILDGELCALDPKGRPDFSALRAAITPGRTAPLVLFAFDVLWAGGEDLRPYALAARKGVLTDLLAHAPSARLRLVDHFEVGGSTLLESACRMGLEGVVSKRLEAPYRSGRGETWLKSKCRPGQEVVIGGWKQAPQGPFRGLLAGVYDRAGRLVYAGSVKGGFAGAGGLLARLQALETAERPFRAGDPPRKTSDIHWVRPELVAAVDIAEWTGGGKLRQASFKGLREDKDPREVVREAAEET